MTDELAQVSMAIVERDDKCFRDINEIERQISEAETIRSDIANSGQALTSGE